MVAILGHRERRPPVSHLWPGPEDVRGKLRSSATANGDRQRNACIHVQQVTTKVAILGHRERRPPVVKPGPGWPRPMSDNGTMVGVKEPNRASLTPLAVPMSLGAGHGGDREKPWEVRQRRPFAELSR